MSTPMRAIEGILGIPPHTAVKTSSLDHEAESQRCLEGVHDWQAEQGITDETMITVTLEAQVHATLALVEQQRIANLIAYQNSFPVSQKVADAIRAEVERGVGLL